MTPHPFGQVNVDDSDQAPDSSCPQAPLGDFAAYGPGGAAGNRRGFRYEVKAGQTHVVGRGGTHAAPSRHEIGDQGFRCSPVAARGPLLGGLRHQGRCLNLGLSSQLTLTSSDTRPACLTAFRQLTEEITTHRVRCRVWSYVGPGPIARRHFAHVIPTCSIARSSSPRSPSPSLRLRKSGLQPPRADHRSSEGKSRPSLRPSVLTDPPPLASRPPGG